MSQEVKSEVGRNGKCRPEATRRRIHKAALALFKQKGFAGVSVDEIARAAGVSKPTLYAHWAGKEDLFVDLLGKVCERVMAPTLAPEASREPIAETLRRVALSYATAVLQPEIIDLHRLFIAEAVRFPELGRRYYAVGPETAHKALAEFLGRRLERAATDPEAAAEHFAALVLSPLRLRLLFAVDETVKPDDLERWVEAGVKAFLWGYGPKA